MLDARGRRLPGSEALRAMTTPGHSPSAAPRDQEDALARLRSLGGRITRSRRELVEFFYMHHNGFTAEEIAAQFPDVDEATVYRALGNLEQAGIVEHAHFGHGPATYRRAGAATVPVVCDSCARVLHVPREDLADLRLHLQSTYGFTVDLGHFALTGRCRRCTKTAKARPASAVSTDS